MFFGTYYHQVDDRGRIRIPPAFKEELGSKFYFVLGITGVLNIFPAASIDIVHKQLMESTGVFDLLDQESMLSYNRNIACAIEDKQGRVVIPQSLLKELNFGKEICSVGMGQYISITSADYKPTKIKSHEEALAHLNKKLAEKKKKDEI